MAEKKCWSKNETCLLISRWKLLPELWDVKSREYRNRIKKRNSLKNLSTEFNTNEIEISRKLHNLRTQFHQELRKCEEKRSGVKCVYESKWEFFRALMFIRKKLSNVRIVNNLKADAVMHRPSTGSNKLIDSDEEPVNVPNKRRRKEDYILEKAMNIIDKPADEFQIFGDFVACEIRNLQSRENQIMLKHMIQRAVLQVSESDSVRCSITSFDTEHPAQSTSSPNRSRPASVTSFYSKINLNSPEEVNQKESCGILKLSGQSYTREYETNT